MRVENLILQLIHLVSLIFYLFIGCIALMAAMNFSVREQLERLFVHMQGFIEPKMLLLVGGAFLVYGGVLLVLLLMGFQRSYLRIALKGSKVLIDRAIVQEYIQDYFKTLFPDQKIALEVVVHPKQRLEILGNFPQIPEKEALFKRIENELGVLLARKLGYKEEFILTFHQA